MDFNPGTLLQTLEDDFQYVTSAISVERADRLRESVFKKWIPIDSSALEDVAFTSFQAANAHCAQVIIPDTPVLRRTRDYLQVMFESGPLQTSVLTLHSALALGKTGPGASRATVHTDFFHKMFMGRLSTTSTILYHHYKSNISPRWEEAELLRSQLYQVDVVEGSKLSSVPKNAKTNRTICTEPSLNMFYQQGAGLVIHELLKRYHNIDFAKQQEINKTMALQGSRTGCFGTIDLQSASDTISLTLVKQILPPNTWNTLRIIRSDVTDIKGQPVRLNMVSTMGNGFTFALQTMIFATLVRSTYLELGITPRTDDIGRNYSVYGDDIICLKEAYDTVVENLSQFGFIVNSEKSYNEGPFRESCGGDFYDGHDVRGVYLKGINNEQDVYSAFNRLSRWSVRHNINLSTTLIYLKGLAKFRPIPFDDGDAEGFKCPEAFANGVYRKYQLTYYVKLASKPMQRRLKPAELEYNPEAVLTAAVGGYIRAQSFSIRSNVPETKVVRCKTPRWDFIPDAGLTHRDYFTLWTTIGALS